MRGRFLSIGWVPIFCEETAHRPSHIGSNCIALCPVQGRFPLDALCQLPSNLLRGTGISGHHSDHWPTCRGALAGGKLRSYGAAMKVIGNAQKQETGRWLNNRGENSHQPFRRRERAMLRFRRMRSLQKFVSVHASVHNHFNHERHLYSRANFKRNRTAALAEWRQLGAV